VTYRKTRALKTKKALINAAATLFAEKSYDDVSIEEITNRAGKAKGTFYVYFENKGDIILELFMKIDAYYVKVSKSLTTYQTSLEKLKVFTEKQLAYISNELGLEMSTIIYANQLSASGFPVYLADERRLLYTIISDLVSEGQSKREFRTDRSAKELTRWITFFMRSIVYDWCIHKGKYSLVKKGQKTFSELAESVLGYRSPRLESCEPNVLNPATSQTRSGFI
jgi:AcrR family transcriptional regulator